jgi:hypothetical protein
MRTARLVGPTADGTSVVLVTEDGEELSVAIDPDNPAVRSLWTPPAPVRRPPPRRETPMDTPLTPRDIQTRIRSGESLDDVVAGSGMDAERIERFAAPVLAEREHLALTALGSSVRRRGEASGHRPLRSVVSERLRAQGVDGDDVRWDAWKVGDSQWQLKADYEVQGEPRHAEFRFDAQGRFSVAEDDEARWLAGEAPSPVAESPGSIGIERDDELALVRATREPSADTEELVRSIAEELGGGLQVVPPAELSAEELDELAADDPETDERETDERETDDEPTLVAVRDEAAEPTIAVVRHLTQVTVEVGPAESGPAEDVDEARSAMDTLYDLLGGFAEESPRAYPGLSDATAVPAVDEHEFEPPAAVLVPAEPDPEDATEQTEPETPETSDASDDDAPEPLIPSPGASRKPGRRKRASVPSWDEIMFGGPKPS